MRLLSDLFATTPARHRPRDGCEPALDPASAGALPLLQKAAADPEPLVRMAVGSVLVALPPPSACAQA